MYDFYTVLENIVLFVSRDIIFKIVLPCMFIVLVFDIIRYMFSKDSKKEDIIEALQGKALGFVALVLLPFVLLWFIGFVSKVTGASVDVDTSIIEKLIGGSHKKTTHSNNSSTGTPN